MAPIVQVVAVQYKPLANNLIELLNNLEDNDDEDDEDENEEEDAE